MSQAQTPTTGHPPAPSNRVYFPALDGIRALALALVFLDHFCQIPLFGLGVSVFFVLSGFLITGILIDTRDQPHRLRNFYIRRTLRIFPVYYAVFLVLLVLTPIFRWHWTSPWLLWPAYLGNMVFYIPQWLPRPDWILVSNGQLTGHGGVILYLGHLWSLCVEEQFYLLWPWIVFNASRRLLLRLCVAVVVFLPFLRILAGHLFPPAAIRANVLFRTLPFQVDALLLGALLALLLRGALRQPLIRIGRVTANLFTLATLAFVFCCVDLHIPHVHQPFLMILHPFTWQFTLVNLLGASLILTALQPGSLLYRLFTLRPLRWLGRISYGAYIFHDIPHFFYRLLAEKLSLTYATPITAAIGVTATLILATLSYRFLERPFLNLKDRLTTLETS